MLKTKVGNVQQNRKLYNHTLTTLYLDTKRCRTCKRKEPDQEKRHTDTLSFLPLGIFNLMVQTTKLDLVLKCTQCEIDEELIEDLKNKTTERNREEISQWKLSLKKKIRDCELCNSITTGADVEAVRGHLQSLKRREFEATARREIIEAAANSVLPGNSTLFPPLPPLDIEKIYPKARQGKTQPER